MIDKITKNRTLAELNIGIVAFDLICAAVVFIITIICQKRCIYYTTGIMIGMIMALLYVAHMNRCLEKALSFEPEDATKITRNGYFVRYLAVCICLTILMLTDIVSPLTAFLGLMAIKISALAEPAINKLLLKAVPYSAEELELQLKAEREVEAILQEEEAAKAEKMRLEEEAAKV